MFRAVVLRREGAAQHLDRFLQNGDKLIDVGPRVVHVQARPRAGLDAELAVQGLRAVVSAADGDALEVHESCEIAGVDAFDVEGDECRAGDALRGPIGGDFLEALHAAEEVGAEVRGVLLDGVHVEGCEVGDGGAEADGLADGGGAGLEFVRELGVRGRGEADLVDHLAASEEGAHFVEDLAGAPEEADTRRAAHFVSRSDEPVATQVHDVDGHVGNTLAGVDEDLCADSMRDLDDVLDGINGAKHVADVVAGDDLGLLRDECAQGVEVVGLLRGEGDVAQDGAGALREELPRNKVGVVFHDGEDDFVAGCEGVLPRVADEVDGLGGVAGVDDVLGVVFLADEVGDGGACGLVRGGGCGGEGVSAAVDVRVE
mmetsp:Transcript_1514/g.4168  ORF Transcript_1514/g.4168 Transcript_1514/m.4168 type:complete len:372 (+) Transcript_1514:124-1239(+)